MIRVILAFLIGVTLTATLIAQDLSGDWLLHWDPDLSGHDITRDCIFKQDGRKLTVTCGTDAPFIGEVTGQKVRLQFKTGNKGEFTATLSGELDERRRMLRGTWQLVPDNRTGKFDAFKQ